MPYDYMQPRVGGERVRGRVRRLQCWLDPGWEASVCMGGCGACSVGWTRPRPVDLAMSWACPGSLHFMWPLLKVTVAGLLICGPYLWTLGLPSLGGGSVS